MNLTRMIVILGWCISSISGALKPRTIEIQQNTLELLFPKRITFTLQATSTTPIEQVVLLFGVNGRSCQQDSATRQEVDFDPDGEISVEWEWDLRDASPMPPGAEVWWQWEIREQTGDTITTEKKTFVIEDNGYTWQNVSRDNVTVHWVEGGRSLGLQILNTAVTSLDRLASTAGVHPEGQIRLNIYPSIDGLKDSLLYEPTWIGGIAFPEYGTLSTAVQPGEDAWIADVIPHELAHLVTGELTFNCYGARIPTWLEEGLAVYSENKRSLGDINLVKSALKKGTLDPLHDLTSGFSVDAGKTHLNYAQSGMVVTFLIETYGAEKMGALLNAIGDGTQFAKALMNVYGMDTDGVDEAWRSSLGYGPVVTSTPRSTEAARATRTPVPTLALWTSVAQITPTEAPTASALPTETSLPTATPTAALKSTETPVPVDPEPTEPPASQKPVGPCAAGLLAPIGLAIFAIAGRRAKKNFS